MHQRTVFLSLALLGMALISSGASAAGPAQAAACAACHGADGNSVNPIWPNLAGQGSSYIVAQLQAFKSGVRQNPSMSPMAAGLEEKDMVEIGDYYAALAPKISPIGEADYSAAEKIYRGGNAERGIPACMACHGPTGAGNAPARYPALHGQQVAYTVAQLKAYRDGTRTTDPHGMMPVIAGKLTDDEIEQLSHYISALH